MAEYQVQTITPSGQKVLEAQLNREANIIRQTCIKAVAEIVKVDSRLQEEKEFIDRCKRLELYVNKGI